jgi:hypothetical protein
MWLVGMGRDPEIKYVIEYKDGELEGKMAYTAVYRTERLAEKGAERLYKRTHGALEDALELNVV